jgi:superfamily II DNA/RNA helicase
LNLSTDLATPVSSFTELGVPADLTAALAERGITTPFPIQATALPVALSGADVIGQGRTGTGKTLAFGLPLIDRLDRTAADGVIQALVVVPTRELCLQVTDDLAVAGAPRDVTVTAVYGGAPIEGQRRALRRTDVVVGTPGRLLDLHRRGDLVLGTAQTVVLDEADEMLDMGFLPDVEQLLEACGHRSQTMLFSATLPGAVITLARRHMDRPVVLVADDGPTVAAPLTRQHFMLTHPMDKPRVLARILQDRGRSNALVFVSTKRMADRLVDELAELHTPAAALHGGMAQAMRERSLARFRDGTVDVLIATEVAARGLDIDALTHVVNYDCPDDEIMYLHRIGRTGRAGAAGVAVTFASAAEATKLASIRKRVDTDGEAVPEVYSPSPLLAELFDLPDETPWQLARKSAPKPTRPRKPRPAPNHARARQPRSAEAPAPAPAPAQARTTRKRTRTRRS